MQSIKRAHDKSFLDKLVISINNPCKNIWDIFVLFIIAYNSIILAY